MASKIRRKALPKFLHRSWERGRDSARKWDTPVTDDLKKTTIEEFKLLSVQISDAQELVAALTPRLNALQGVINTYGWSADVEQLEQADDWLKHPDLAKPKGQQIAGLCREFFANNGNTWSRLSELFVYLTSRGMTIGGKNPNSTLSAHLSNSGRFEGDRGKGWRLKPEFMPTKLHTMK
jgi:hypothetical protein